MEDEKVAGAAAGGEGGDLVGQIKDLLGSFNRKDATPAERARFREQAQALLHRASEADGRVGRVARRKLEGIERMSGRA